MSLILRIIILFYCTACPPCHAVIITKEYKEYLTLVLKKYTETLIPRDFQQILPERPKVDNSPSPYAYTLPKLFIWDPLQQYEEIFSIKPPLCEQHHHLLEPGRWSNGSSNSLNPRVILEDDGPALLIYREYYCNSGISRHYIRSTDGDFLRYVSSFMIEVPFILTHKIGCTRSFVKKIRDLVANGLSFNLIQAMYMENQLQKCNDKRIQFKKHCELYENLLGKSLDGEQTQEFIHSVFEEHERFLTNLCPSNDYLCEIFLKDFKERKEWYDQSMRTIRAKSLMADHTFKVTVNIGINRKSDHTWVKQFNSLFVVLNENHEVVTWKLTKKEQFDMVKDVLKNLRDRISEQGESIEIFMIDNCCKLKKKIQEVFGKDVLVLLDLFHAVQRITKTIRKKHAFQKDCVHDLSMVFRAPDDTGKQRTKPTPDIEELLANIEKFREKWEHIDMSTKDYLLKDNFNDQIDNLKEHISSGCLSGIPPGYSTSTNECLHEKINDLFAGAKMGPELAVALLTVFFYTWNSRKKNSINGIPLVKPLRMETEALDNDLKERFGLGAELPSASANISYGTTEVGTVFNSSLSRAFSMLCLFQDMKEKSRKKCQISIYELFFESEILKFLLKSTKVSMPSENRAHSQANTAKMFGMKVEQVARDGDCLFSAIGTVISNLLHSNKESASIIEHFKSLGLTSSKPNEELAIVLRSVMVDELLKDKEKYIHFLEGNNKANYDELVQQYRQAGVFSGDVGDLMVKALANVLRVPIVLFTSIDSFPVVTITPHEFNDISSTFSIYLAFEREGPGHYDPVLIDTDENNEEKPVKKCSCGSSSKEVKQSCSNAYRESGKRHYVCKCPCLERRSNCSENCKCKGCSNPYGVKPVSIKTGSKRKRSSQAFGGKRRTGIEFLLDEDVGVEGGKWTEEENAILLQLVDNPEILNEGRKDECNIGTLTERYNECVKLASGSLGMKDLKARTEASIEQKLSHLRKKKELLYLVVAQQLNNFMKELS